VRRERRWTPPLGNWFAPPGSMDFFNAHSRLRQLSWMPSLIIGLMQDLVSGSAAATIQFLKGVGAAVVFIAVYSYWRWLPQPHSF
jgi:hypothetical protein